MTYSAVSRTSSTTPTTNAPVKFEYLYAVLTTVYAASQKSPPCIFIWSLTEFIFEYFIPIRNNDFKGAKIKRFQIYLEL